MLPSGAAIDTVTYQVLDSGGVTIAGPANIDVSRSPAPVALEIFVPATPAGDAGDSVKLTATATDGESCTGTSAPFEVVAGNNLAVTMTLTCGTGTPSGPSSNIGIDCDGRRGRSLSQHHLERGQPRHDIGWLVHRGRRHRVGCGP